MDNFIGYFEIALGLFAVYSSIRGAGMLFEISGVYEGEEEIVRKGLRRFYLSAGILLVLRGGLDLAKSMLYTGAGADAVAKFDEAAVPFLSYGLLNTLGWITLCILIVILGVLLWFLRRHTYHMK